MDLAAAGLTRLPHFDGAREGRDLGVVETSSQNSELALAVAGRALEEVEQRRAMGANGKAWYFSGLEALNELMLSLLHEEIDKNTKD